MCIRDSLEVDPAAAKALRKLKGVVTIAAHEGPLPESSHVVLPATSWAEMDATYVNKKGKVQASERALRPQGDAQPGWLLIARLGKALGFATTWKKLSEVRRAMSPETTGGVQPAASIDQAAAPEVTP